MIQPNYTYKATVTNVVDADTIDAVTDCGFHITMKQRLRLARVNAPEMNSADPAIRAKAIEAKTYVSQSVLLREVVIITQKADAFGRYLAEVLVIDPLGSQLNLSDEMLRLGYAIPYVRKS